MKILLLCYVLPVPEDQRVTAERNASHGQSVVRSPLDSLCVRIVTVNVRRGTGRDNGSGAKGSIDSGDSSYFTVADLQQSYMEAARLRKPRPLERSVARKR